MTDIAEQENDDELMRQLGLTAKGFLLSRMKADDPLRSSVEDLFRSGGKAASLTAELLALNV